MSVDLIVAMISRREAAAREKAQALDGDPVFKAAARDYRAVQAAMAALKIDINHYTQVRESQS